MTEEEHCSTCNNENEEFYLKLKSEAEEVLQKEPEMAFLLRENILSPDTRSFEEAVAHTLCSRLFISSAENNNTKNGSNKNSNGSNSNFCSLRNPETFFQLTLKCMHSKVVEHGSTMAEAIRADAMAVLGRDPATDSLLEVVLFAKGYSALVAHRVAHRLWLMKRKFAALFVQSQTSAAFGMDIHPLAQIGKGVMMDHGTGVVIGETATIGEGCTILHGVTLGGTGKDHGDRHPKVGNNVLIGAGSTLLGKIRIGDCAKIGAASVLLRDIPAHATAVGSPARIVGRATEINPGKEVDIDLHQVSKLGRTASDSSSDTTVTASLTDISSIISGLYISDGDEISDSCRAFYNNSSTDGQDLFCPYVEFYKIAETAPNGSVTILTLTDILLPEGVPRCLINASFFELDHFGKGYIRTKSFVKDAPSIISRVCVIPIEKVADLVMKFKNQEEEARTIAE